MCYHISQTKSLSELEEIYNVRRSNIFAIGKHAIHGLYLDGFKHPELAILTQEKPKELYPAKWGLIPKNIIAAMQKKYYLKIKGDSLNAKSENIFDYPLYSNSIYTKRCIIPITGFIGLHHLNNEIYPHFIERYDQSTISIAGIYSVSDNTVSFTMLTKNANSFMARIHNKAQRQLVMLDGSFEKDWLSKNLNDKQIMEIINSNYNDNELKSYTISKKIFEPKHTAKNRETVLKPVIYSELENQLF
ncbi:SOS response-associated peptidase [Aquimarina agarivorans]|uniref:SOS response-associated peptidase n=1 Tax=Aquimarina agarivorans TaxID=980584 RepID=UPI000248E867|nr:SOS response-associated peptidase family protein [Aquimarina agarivorans]